MKCIAGILLLWLPLFAVAEVVVPIESVENHVNIRMTADSTSEIVGHLNQGEHLPLVESIADWHEVEIAGGATGFISADWTVVLAELPAKTDDSESSSEVAIVNSAPADNPEADELETPADPSVTVVVEADDDAVVAEHHSMPDADISDDVEQLSEADSDSVVEDEKVEEVTQDDDPQEVVVQATEEIAIAESELEDDAMADAEVGNERAQAAVDTNVAEEILVAVIKKEDVVGEPTVNAIEQGPQGLPGPQGPPGVTGPPGPAGAASIEGAVGFLTRFTAPTIGGTSLIYDDGNNIGIGTTDPKQRLEVNGNIQIHQRNSSVAGLIITQSDGDTGYIMHNRASTLTIGAGSVDRITIDRNGNVGFGVSRPSNPIEMANGAHVTAGGVWTNSSSRARKENISGLSLDDALDALTQLEPVHFNYKNDQAESHVGFIAEDVPDLVATIDRDGLSSMDIVAVLTRVVQEQQKKIEELEARIDRQ